MGRVAAGLVPSLTAQAGLVLGDQGSTEELTVRACTRVVLARPRGPAAPVHVDLHWGHPCPPGVFVPFPGTLTSQWTVPVSFQAL